MGSNTNVPTEGLSLPLDKSASQLPEDLRRQLEQDLHRARIQVDQQKLQLESKLPPGPEKENLLRGTLLDYYSKYNTQIAGIVHGPQMQEKLRKYSDIVGAMRTANVDKGIVAEREAALKYIVGTLAAPPRPRQQDTFSLYRFVGSIDAELREAKKAQRSMPKDKADDRRAEALQEEIDFLSSILDAFHIPHSDALIASFDAAGRKLPTAEQEKLHHDIAMAARLGVVLVCGSFAAATALLTLLAAKDKKNLKAEDFTATFLWLAPVALAIRGPRLFEGKTGEVSRQEETILRSPVFLNFAAKYPTLLREPVENLMKTPKIREDSLGKLAILRQYPPEAEGKDPKAKETRKRAKDWLRTTMGASAVVTDLLDEKNEPAFIMFAKQVLDTARDDDAARTVLRYLEIAKAPPPEALAPPKTTPVRPGPMWTMTNNRLTR